MKEHRGTKLLVQWPSLDSQSILDPIEKNFQCITRDLFVANLMWFNVTF